jgi:hypothetical protein
MPVDIESITYIDPPRYMKVKKFVSITKNTLGWTLSLTWYQVPGYTNRVVLESNRRQGRRHSFFWEALPAPEDNK